MKKILIFFFFFLLFVRLWSCKKEAIIPTPQPAISSLSSESDISLILMRANLYTEDGTLLDGNLTQYDSSFCNCIDGLDARKMMNPGENLGIQRDGFILSVERRTTVVSKDTTQLWMSHLVPAKSYFIEVVISNFNKNIQGVVQDLVLNKETPLIMNDTTIVPFTVSGNDSTRFRVVFGLSKPEPKIVHLARTRLHIGDGTSPGRGILKRIFH
ncbi:MAG TPA: hypothetical protein VG621_02655 [Candidatus Paceibacterota bacterium]|nr:hypothetical protein [Candidatus Paceibacterota bacterium]